MNHENDVMGMLYTIGDTRHSGKGKTNHETKQFQSSGKENKLAHVIPNSAYCKSKIEKYKQFEQLPANCRRILDMDKERIENLRLKTTKIKDIYSQYGPQFD